MWNCAWFVVRREVYENCALLVYDAASSGNFLPTFHDSLSFHPQWSSTESQKTGIKRFRLNMAPSHIIFLPVSPPMYVVHWTNRKLSIVTVSVWNFIRPWRGCEYLRFPCIIWMFEFAKYHINIEFLKRTVVCLIWRRSFYLRCEEYQFFEQRVSQKVKLPVIRQTVEWCILMNMKIRC